MKNSYKKIFVSLISCLTLIPTQAQTIVTIPAANSASTGANTTIHRKPLGSTRAYERTAMKYTQSEIGMLGNITAIGFYCDTVINPGVTPVKVYLKEVPDSSFTSSTVAFEETAATLVFDDTLQPTAFVRDSFVTIVLTTPFLHATTNNIEVIIETNSGGTAGTDLTTLSKGFRYFAQTNSSMQYWQSGNGSGVIPVGNGFITVNRPNIQLTIAPAPSCTSPPTAGLAIASPSSVCAGTTTTLFLSGNSTGIGMTYQWLTSSDSITWSPVNGATNYILTDTINTAAFFACVLSCSGLSDTSAGVAITVNSFYECYCHQTIGGGCGTSAIDSVGILSTSLANGATGCSAGNYYAYPASGNTTASLTQGQVYMLTTKFTGNVRAIVWIDYNQDGTFEPSEWKQICIASAANTPVSIPLFIPFTALPGQTGMRIRSRSSLGGGATIDSTSACTTVNSGETEDYVITIVTALPCTSPPTAGTTIASLTTACPANIINLALNGNSNGNGMTYQWISSTDGITWNVINGATLPLYSDTIHTAISYKCILSCSGLSDTSSIATVTLNSFLQCYCTQTIGGGCATTAIDSVAITGTTLLNGLTGCSTNNYSVYPSSGSTTATLTQGQTYTLTTRFTGNVRAGIWIDYNQNGTFEPSEYLEICTTSTAAADVAVPLSIPLTALPGQTGMRIRSRATAGTMDSTSACATFGTGETEDYIVTINVASGINDQSQTSEMYVFPNPTNGLLTVVLNGSSTSKLTIQVMNIEGEMIYNQQTTIANGATKKSVDLTGFAKGIYFIRVINDTETVIKKISLQ